MRTLYHLWLSPFCRTVRVALGEKKLEFQMQTENIWERRADFLAINPAGEVPVLVDKNNAAISGCGVICEYLEETYPDVSLLPQSSLARAETRRLVHWFNTKFNTEVTENLLGEKMMKRFLGLGEPSATAIRAGYRNLKVHLDYITFLIERRNWIVGDDLTFADIAAATHISSLDYMAEISWEDHETVKTWYARIKSRPSFRTLLGDRIPGAPPPNHYADLDF